MRRGLLAAGIPVHVAWSLSIRCESHLVITTRLVTDRRLGYDDLVTTSVRYRDGRTAVASADVELHRLTYSNTSHRALLVCLPPHAMTLASRSDSLELPCCTLPVGTPADGVSAKLFGRSAVLVRGRGLCTTGFDPGSCLDLARRIEDASRHLIEGSR